MESSVLPHLVRLQRSALRRAPVAELVEPALAALRELFPGAAVAIELGAEPDVRSAGMSAPLVEDGMVHGAVLVGSPERCYPAADRERLAQFAAQVAVAFAAVSGPAGTAQALHDPLTGLATPALYEDRLAHALTCAQREAAPTALLLIGAAGATADELVAMAAQRVRGAVRATDTPARLPGNRFGVLLHNVHHDHQAMLVARRILERLQAPFPIGERQALLMPSVGIAFSDVGERDPAVPLRRAELALAAARRAGGGRCELFTSAAPVGAPVDLRADLARALTRGELVLRYQPIVELATARVTGFEALARWDHPTQGTIAALELLPLAAEAGLIRQLGRWILEEACGQVARWSAERPGEAPLTVSVNLSAPQLREPDLPRMVAAVLAQTGLPPACLTLEITESMLLDDDRTIARLAQLKAIGAQLAIDDFGLGYASLAHLRRYPVDMIKIDKMFVDELTSDVGGPTLTRAIVGLGRSLRVAGGAEGGDPAVQGHFAKPMTPEEANALLAAQPRR